MNHWAGCWADQSLTNISVCVVGDTNYLDTEYVYGVDTNCPAFRECKEGFCPTDNAGINNADTCWVSSKSSSWNPLHDWSNVEKIGGVWDETSSSCVQCNTKFEDVTCGDTFGTYYPVGGPACTKNGIGFGNFEKACDNSIEQACDEKANGLACSPPAGGTCNALGKCLTPATLALTASASPTEVTFSPDTSTITFTVKDGTGASVNGALVNGINITAGAGTLTPAGPASCTTVGTGICTVTYNAPASPTTTIATISATKATKGGFTDSGPASATVTVTSCPTTGVSFVKFLNSTYPLGGTFGIQAAIGNNDPNTGDYVVCLYKPGVLLTDIGALSHPCVGVGCGDIFTDNTQSASIAGIWTVSLSLGLPGSCVGFPPTGCIKSTEVIAAGPPPCTPNWVCGAWSACAAGTQSRNCVDTACLPPAPPTTENRSCCTVATQAADCPLAKPKCKPSTLQCVACIVDSDCPGANDRCYEDQCMPCKGEKEEVNFAGICCAGLNWWDVDFDSKEECTSACNPSVNFYCNPLRQTVEDIVQGGQKLIGYVLGLIGSIALLFIVIAGMMYMTSAGNEEKIASSKRILTGAIIGVTIALLAYSFLQVLMSILNM